MKKSLLTFICALFIIQSNANQPIKSYKEANYPGFSEKRKEFFIKPLYGIGFKNHSNAIDIELGRSFRPGGILGLEVGGAYFFTQKIGVQISFVAGMGGYASIQANEYDSYKEVHMFNRQYINLSGVYFQPIDKKKLKGLRITLGPSIYLNAVEKQNIDGVKFKNKFKPTVGANVETTLTISMYKKEKFFLFPGIGANINSFKSKSFGNKINASNIYATVGLGWRFN